MQDWKHLETADQLTAAGKASYTKPQLIFKHSIRCGISAQAWHRLASATNELKDAVDLHYLDLINFRQISNQVSFDFDVPHQSPQVLLIEEGKAVYHASHFSINPDKILQRVENSLQQ
jgi:bacillithiol system protein YtxJ